MSDERPTGARPAGGAPAPDPSSLKGLTMALGIGPAESGQDPLLGRDIGGVTIVRLIAEGGMGRVYEGKQEKPRRTVAVKVMRPGLASPSLLKRFEYEAEVLGRLQHPGIAHIYSVGVHTMGHASVPYFVMEYIADARTLTKYAADLKLPTRQRLDLFRSVCDAVAHGHQKGVIHRDLKPSNILVDATGQPKVIDFGVARATDSDMAVTTMQTDVGQLIGTLQYMSPEQFKADPNDIDVRSDVYALGVILYELLAGKMPYDVKKKAIHEVARIVQEDDPTPLSSFNRALKGDVAVIAGKCLEKDRGRRYSSASEVGADIGRFLTGEPISASPPGFVDGLVRLAKKHKAAAVAASAVLATLVAAIVGVSFFALKAERQRESAVRERDRANASEREALDAKEIASEQTASAEQRLYYANLYRLGRMTAGDRSGSSADLFEETVKLSRSETLPIELRCLRAGLDGAQAVFRDFSKDGVLAVSPDGGRFASPVADHDVAICEIDTGARTVLRGHDDEVIAIVFSPDGTTLATASKDKTARVWDAKTGDMLHVLAGHADALTAIAYAADGDAIVTASKDKTARVWDTKSGEQRHVLRGHREALSCIAVSRDGASVATGCSGGTAVAWDVVSGDKKIAADWENCVIVSLAFSPDSAFLAVGNDQGRAMVWDISTGRRLAAIGERRLRLGQPCKVAFTSDGKRLVTASDGIVTTWNAESLAKNTDLVVGESVTLLFQSHWSIGTITDVKETECQAKFPNPAWVNKSLVAPRLEHLLVFDTRTSAIAFTIDATAVFGFTRDGTLGVWDVLTGMRTALLAGHQAVVLQARTLGNADCVITKANDGCVRLWSLKACVIRGCCLLEHPRKQDHAGYPSDIACSPDGRFIATGAQGFMNLAELSLCDARTAEKVLRWEIPLGTSPYSVTFSPDGARLAAVRNDWQHRIELADTATGKCIELSGHALFVNQVAFSPDARFLASAADDGTLRFWDPVTGKPAYPSAKWQTSLAEITADQRPDIIVDDFERDSWSPWQTSGEAFGTQPCAARQQTGHNRREGSIGTRLATSYNDTASGTGALESPPIRIERSFITMKLNTRPSYDTSAILEISGTAVRRALGPADKGPDKSRMIDVIWDVREFAGQEVKVRFIDEDKFGGGVAVDHIVLTDAPHGESMPGVVYAHAGGVAGVTFSPGGLWVLTTSFPRPWGKRAYIGGEHYDFVIPADGSARLWDMKTGRIIATMPFTGREITPKTFSPDGRKIVLVEGNDAVVRSAPSGEQLLRLQGHGGVVNMATFSADGALIATASEDDTARVWDAATGAPQATLRGHVGGVTAVSFNDDGSRLLIRGGDNKASVWDTHTGAQVLTIGNEECSVWRAKFSAGGEMILTCSADAKTGHAGIWGLSNADISSARKRSRETQERLRPLVDRWMEGGIDAALQELEKAKGQLSPEDYREASIMLVVRGNKVWEQNLGTKK